MTELKQKLEALLFSSGRSMSVEELSRLCRSSEEEIEKLLKEIQYEYSQRDSSIMVVNEGKSWKLIAKGKYLDVVKKIITQTELTKSVMETLAVIAFRYPIKQADLIKIRSNKAYDHLGQLEELGYISRQKHGRTKLIKLTQKFFDYFDLPPEKLKEKFHDFESIAKAISEKEVEIEKIKEEQIKQSEEDKQKQEEEKKKIEREIEDVDKGLEEIKVINEDGKEKLDIKDGEGHEVKLDVVEPKTEVIEEEPKIEKEKIGELEIVDRAEESEEEKEEQEAELDEKEEGEQQEEDVSEKKETGEIIEGKEKTEKEADASKEEEFVEEGEMETTPEMEKMIDKRVEEMTKAESEAGETEEEETEEKEEESAEEEKSQ